MLRWLSGLRVALTSLVRRRRLDDELDEEMQYHLDRQIDEGVKAGLTPDEARYAALRAMGPVAKSKEESRDLRTGALIEQFFGDLRYAARTLLRTPGFSVLAVVILALGIGANTAVFSVVNGVLLKPLPYPDADRIVAVRTAALTTGQINPLITLANFRDWRDQSSSFDAMASYRGGEAPITPGDTAEYGRHANVDRQLFRVLGIEPAIGRSFLPEDVAPDTGQLVALISHGYWQTRFGADPGILKRTMRVGNGLRAIVGVMPPGFQFPEPDRRLDASTGDANGQPYEPQFPRGRAIEAGCPARGRASRAEHGRCEPRATVPGQQQRARRRRHAAAGRPGWGRALHALFLVGHRRRGAVDCLRQYGHAPARQRHRAHERNRGPRGPGCESRAARPATGDGEFAAGARCRRGWHSAGALGSARTGDTDAG